MQKKLLTLAVAGALAAPGVALAQVEVYGFVSMSLNKFKYDNISANLGQAAAPSVSKWDVASHASNYGLRGRENIGAGLTAWFQIEQNAPMERSNNTATTPASRNSAVGIQGGWGNVFIGQWTTPWADLDSLWAVGAVGGWTPVTSIIGRRETTGSAPNINCANTTGQGVPTSCDAAESGGGVGHPFWRRPSQAVFYYTPVFGGAQVKVAYQTNEGKSTGANGSVTADPSLWSGSVQWAGMGGRARIGAAYDAHKDFSTVGKTDKGWRVTGGWNFGVVDIGLAYETMEYALSTAAGGAQGATYSGNDCEATQYAIGVAVPVGQGAIRASWAKAKDLEGTGCTAVTGSNAVAGFGGATTWNLGYDYRFSKRTTVGFGYATIDNEAGSATAPGGTFTWTGVPPNQVGNGTATNGALPGGDISTFFVHMVHRF